MKYYAHINSKDVMTGIDMSMLSKDEYDSEDVQNIEVSEEIYNEREKYAYIGGEIVLDPEYDNKQAAKFREELVTKLYEIKAAKAYGGVLVNDLYKFETNQTSITNTVASLALMADTATASWKFYVNDEPVIVLITKPQLAGIAQFGQAMINECFAIEGRYNEELKAAEVEELISEEWRDAFIADATEEMEAVNNVIEIQLVKAAE